MRLPFLAKLGFSIAVYLAITLDSMAQPFITTWKTDNPGSSNANQIILRIGGNYDIYWEKVDEPSVNGNLNNQVTNVTITFPAVGIYRVEITGIYPQFLAAGDAKKLLTVEQWGDNVWASMDYAFYGCENLHINATDAPDLSLVTDMSYMFADATSFNEPIGHWNVGNVTEMRYLFYNADAFNQDIGSWDVSQVINMTGMFQLAVDFNQDIGSWVTGNVQVTNYMFDNASSFNQDIGDWDVSNVGEMTGMFRNANSFNQDLESWDTGNVTHMLYMFMQATSFNGDIRSWNVSNVRDMRFMFFQATAFNQNIGGWDVTSVNEMSSMFGRATSFNEEIGTWNMQQVGYLDNMFNGATAFNQYLGNWNLFNARDLSGMFYNATSFNQDIGNWNVSHVERMSDMFHGAVAFNQYIGGWDMSHLGRLDGMFNGATSFNQDIGDWDVSNCYLMSETFYNATSFNQDIGDWDVHSVQTFSYMFQGATTFNQDIGDWDVSMAHDMRSMFNGASSFDRNIGGWAIGEVEYMSDMLNGSGLSMINYDATLIGWSEQTVKSNVALGVNGLVYCNSTFARSILGNLPNGWNIIGDTQNCPPEAFMTTWKTNNPGSSAPNQISIPTVGGGYNYDIYWEKATDASVHGNLNSQTGSVTLTFPAAGIYRVEITGDFPRIRFNATGDRLKLLSVDNWGYVSWISMESAFRGCTNLIIPATDTPDVSLVTDMSQMFRDAPSINPIMGLWDVSAVQNMSHMFYGATVFNQDISGWDVSSVTNMSGMFGLANQFNQDIGNWTVGQVQDMSYMFSGASLFNAELGSWDVSNVTNMSSMFFDAYSFNGGVGTWDVSHVTNMSNMFHGAINFNKPLGGWQVGNVTDMAGMFYGAQTFNQNLHTWDVSHVTNMSFMFRGAELFNGVIATWDVSQVTNMQGMFQDARAFDHNIGDWNVAAVNDMSYMFFDARSFGRPIGNWQVGTVTNMTSMFEKAQNFNQVISGWDVSNVTNMSNMFYEAWTFDQDISAWNVESVTSMRGMFYDAESFDHSLGEWDIGNVTDIFQMLIFSGLSVTSYDATLIGWSQQTVKPNLTLWAHFLPYCNGAAARAILVSAPNNWTIIGDVNNCPPCPTAPTGTPGSRCGTGSVALGASGGSNGQYRWYTVPTGGTPIPGAVNDSFGTPSLTVSTTYHVAIHDGVCESLRTAVIATINPVPNASISTIACTATSATLRGPDGMSIYLWSTGALTQQITVSTPGSYTLIVASMDACVSTVSPPFTFTGSFCNQPPVANDVLSVTSALVTVVPLLTSVSDPDGNINLSSLNILVPPQSGASASINANHELVVDYDGISAVGVDQLTLEICDLALACTSFFVTIERELVTGDIQSGNSGLLLYPNPVTEHFTLELQDPAFGKQADFYMIDVTGRTVEQRLFDARSPLTIDVRGQAKGLYFLRVVAGDKIFTRTIIKQ